MKPNPTLQKKRKAPKGSGLRILNASTGNHKRRKQRAATASAEDLGEVPGVGIVRALIVIALIHVVAIGGIWLHSKWSKENVLKATPVLSSSDDFKPTLVPGGKHVFVESGDNYLTLAREHKIDVDTLKAANNSAALTLGLHINIPSPRIESTVLSESVNEHQAAAVSAPPVRPVSRPLIQPNELETQAGSRPGVLVEVESSPPARPAPEDKPVLIKPRVRPAATQVAKVVPRAIPVAEPLSGKTYKVVKGDSIWRLSKRFGVSQQSLMSANGIKDPSKLRLGATLKIPVR